MISFVQLILYCTTESPFSSVEKTKKRECGINLKINFTTDSRINESPKVRFFVNFKKEAGTEAFLTSIPASFLSKFSNLNDFCLDLISTYFRGAISIPATYLDIKDEVIPLFLFISFFLQYTPRAIMIKESSFFFRIFD